MPHGMPPPGPPGDFHPFNPHHAPPLPPGWEYEAFVSVRVPPPPAEYRPRASTVVTFRAPLKKICRP
eukprot:1008934-Prorocentrum_minimum.AAC.1